MEFLLKVFVLLWTTFATAQQDESWQLGPFVKDDAVNPIMGPRADVFFFCPIRQQFLAWEAKDIFNPGAIVKDGKVHLLYRAEDFEGRYNGTSRLGLAISEDGIEFQRRAVPVLYPDHDGMIGWEWEGGCEDPRVVEFNGTYIMTYTAYDGELARLMVATSQDLYTWRKHGSAFGAAYLDMWSKSGSIVTHVNPSSQKQEAVMIDGKFWMYFGETDIYVATSQDLVHWTPVSGQDGEFNLTSVVKPRLNNFDSDIVEPGPPALLTDEGIKFIYNSRNLHPLNGGHPDLPERTYSAGQVLINATNPTQVLARLESYFFTPEKDYEIIGQVGNVVFVQGLVPFNGTWFLYYGTADSKIAVAKIH